jgi:hypothetical protein
MAYDVPHYTTDSNIHLTNAYAFIRDVLVNFGSRSGHATFSIHPTPNDWDRKPVESILVSMGEVFENGEQMPTLDEFLSQPAVAQAMGTIGLTLYQLVAAKHPAFRDSTIIPTSA